MANTQGFLILNVYALLIIVITSIIFYKKDRQKKVEDNTYALLLLTTIFVSLSGIILGVLVNPSYNINANILILANKVYLICLSIWIMILTFYTLCISWLKEEKIAFAQNIFKIIVAFNVLMIILLPIDINITDKVTALGLSIYYTYTVFALGFIFQIICIIIDHKNIKSKKYIPIYLLAFFGIIVLILQMINPELNYVINPAIVLITFIMFHTIENPDVKVIRELNLAREKAERANHAKSDFLSSMSHEIRTPLNAVVGFSEDLTYYKDQVPKEVIEDIEDIKTASQTLLEIVGNILDINKIESEKMDIVETTYNFKEEISNLARITASRIGEKPIEFKLDIAEDIPDELYGDKTHIKEIITNLLTNAIKYTEKGEVTLSAKCINKTDKCMLIISVKDTGRGIKKEDISKLFTKFERLDVEKNTTTSGTGLGLAITKSLVELLHGTINVESSYGKGSIFMVNIPQKISKMVKEDYNPEVEIKPTTKKKILIVDDNALNIKVIKKLLQKLKYEVAEALSGAECLEKIKTDSYDLILMDIMMPELSGTDTLTKLREMGIGTPVVALTAAAVSGAEEKYLDLGFDAYLAKPVTKEELEKVLIRIFNSNDTDRFKDVEEHIITDSN